jgi:hypothetical protein
MEETKICKTCKEIKPISEFYDRDTDCKKCRRKKVKAYANAHKEEIRIKSKERTIRDKEKNKERRKKYYEENKEKVLKKIKEYRDANPEKIKEIKRKEYEKDKEKIKARSKQWSIDHPEEVKARHKKYYEENKEILAQKAKERREKNIEEIHRKQREYYYANLDTIKEKDKVRSKIYRQKHREEIKLKRIANKSKSDAYFASPRGQAAIWRYQHKRRSRILSTPCTLTHTQWNKIIADQENECNMCGRKFTKDLPPTKDHILPLTKGHGLTFENVQALCKPCNSKKYNNIDYNLIQSWINGNNP